jgi:acetoin utilization deacetylase AcuC-like enzyme
MPRDVGLLYDPLFLEHDTGSHPENAGRLRATMTLLEESGILGRLARLEARDATPEELALVHDARYVGAVERAAAEGGGWADPDTLITPRSYDVAVRAAGAVLAGVDGVMRREVAAAFALVRPPGHHATPVQAMGFCLFNSVAVAAAYALDRYGLERIAIVDYDVHHGNGTQDAFYDDGRVLYVSTHEYPFYPGTGAAHETGTGDGRGTTVNIPLPDACGDAEYARAFDEVVLPALRRVRPDVILVSAGYDAHYADPLAMERLSVDGYGALVQRLVDVAGELCGGRLVCALEGGYDFTALSWSVRRTIEVLLGAAPTPDPLGPDAHPRTPAEFEARLAEVKRIHGL